MFPNPVGELGRGSAASSSDGFNVGSRTSHVVSRRIKRNRYEQGHYAEALGRCTEVQRLRITLERAELKLKEHE